MPRLARLRRLLHRIPVATVPVGITAFVGLGLLVATQSAPDEAPRVLSALPFSAMRCGSLPVRPAQVPDNRLDHARRDARCRDVVRERIAYLDAYLRQEALGCAMPDFDAVLFRLPSEAATCASAGSAQPLGIEV